MIAPGRYEVCAPGVARQVVTVEGQVPSPWDDDPSAWITGTCADGQRFLLPATVIVRPLT